MEQEDNSKVKENGAALLTDRLKEIWRNFMEEFQQSFQLNQLDPVLSLLRELEPNSQNPIKKRRIKFLEMEESMENENENDYLSSLEKKVFSNHLLAKLIFKHLSCSDLFSCRLMSTYWNEFATEFLLIKVNKIEFKSRLNRFYLRGSNWKSLDMFTELLKRSKNFPCNQFVFWGGNLGNDDAQRFFSFYGPSIDSITIRLDEEGQSYGNCECDCIEEEKGYSLELSSPKVIGMVLSQHLPFLEQLELYLDRVRENNDWSGDSCLFFPPDEEIELPYLESLTYAPVFDDDAPLRQLLEAAINLERFDSRDCFEVDWMDNVFETEKVHCITDLVFPVEVEELEKVEEILKHEPKLIYLSLSNLDLIYEEPETWAKISKVLSQLLRSNQKYLNFICSFGSLGFLPFFQLPIMKNVENVDLAVLEETTFNSQDIHESFFAFLPRGATFTRNFPRLKYLSLSFDFEMSNDDGDAAEWWSKCFVTDEIVPTVKELHIICCYCCPPLWMQKFSKMLPNVEELTVTNIRDFPTLSKILWKSYRKLKNLTVKIDLSSPLNSYPALDSSFTGLSPELCKQMENLSTSELESLAEKYMELSIYLTQPSLLNLKDLETLEINLEGALDPNYSTEHPKILSLMTGVFAFKPLKNLKQVTVQYKKLENFMFHESLLVRDLELLAPYKVVIKKD